MATRSSTSTRLITPKSWGVRQAELARVPSHERVCNRCFCKGLTEVRTIAGAMMRCPRCKQLQF